ncbi:hypothetical protein G5B40_17245 [Pikeienuella piscinae]|uniref:Tetratricopeptide repeat protein n=1 Tax=Pikeienuella piscinae TaxID=2748098 RepID=A0A7L5BXC4_9RHOB|nr:hypothetical protein [Pikeienuella piscinae]QIE57030.1 hypothetical protein G5B40_17245 [Pikeienuella piscinae]
MAGPGVTWAYRDLATSYANAGRPVEAEELLEALLAHDSGITVRRVIDSLPPMMSLNQPYFIEDLRRVGAPAT